MPRPATHTHDPHTQVVRLSANALENTLIMHAFHGKFCTQNKKGLEHHRMLRHVVMDAFRIKMTTVCRARSKLSFFSKAAFTLGCNVVVFITRWCVIDGSSFLPCKHPFFVSQKIGEEIRPFGQVSVQFAVMLRTTDMHKRTLSCCQRRDRNGGPYRATLDILF